MIALRFAMASRMLSVDEVVAVLDPEVGDESLKPLMKLAWRGVIKNLRT